MKIAITGATEFIGAFLCRYFHAAGHQILALGTEASPHPALLKIATWQQVDFLQPINHLDADACIHAAFYHTGISNYAALFLNHVESTLNITAAAKTCSHFIQLSSSSVYSFGDKPVKETDAQIELTTTDYGEIKLLAEEVVGFEIPQNQRRLILRPRAIYGIGDPVFLPHLFNLLKKQTVFCPVSKNVKTSLTHIENIAYAISLFFQQTAGSNFQILNVADEKPYCLSDTILQFLSAIEEKKLEMIFVPARALSALGKLNPGLGFIKELNPAILKAIHHNSVLDLFSIRKDLKYNPPRNLQNSMAEIAASVKSAGGKKAYLQQLPTLSWR